MAILYLEGGRRYDNLAAISETLASLGVGLRRWELPDDPATREWLAADTLDDNQKAALLAAVAPRFEELQRTRPYTAHDLVVLHPGVSGFEALTTTFARPHRHPDDEVRYILDGEGYFGIFDGSGRQALLKVEAGEYVNVPAGAEHWFELGPRQRVKAVRYFSATTGWTAEFTDRPTALHPPR